MKRKRLYIFIVALLLIGIPLMSSAQINVSLPETYYGSAGDTVMIPVTTGDLTGEGVESYEFTLTFDSSVLEVIDFEAGPVSEGMTIVKNAEVDGEFSLAASHTEYISGSGQLVELEVALKGAGVTDIVWSSFMFNDGTPEATTTDCKVGVDVVRVGLSDLTGQIPDSIVVPIMVSDMTGLDIESYEFTLTYNEDLMNVYDVDKSGTLSEDMTVISNDVDGQLNVAAALTGVLEGSGTLLNLKVEFTGAGTDDIRFGDFLFNDGTPLDVTADTATVTVLPKFSILLNDLQFGEIGDTIDLTISVDGDLTGSEIESYEFELDYPGSLMDFIEVNKTGTVSEGMTVTPNSTDGTLNIAAASIEYLVGVDQDLLHISFKVVDGGEGEAYFNSFNFNDGAVDADYDDTSKVATGLIDVSLPDASGLVGDTILYPINVEDVTGLGIEAYEFTLNFDNSTVDVIGYDKSSTLSEDFTVLLNDATAGEVTVAASMGTVELTGEGVLLYLKMVLITEATVDFTWSDFIFNAGTPASDTHSGTLDIITNTAPEFVNTLPDTNIYEGQALSYTYTATDPEGDDLIFALIDSIEGMTVGEAGVLAWTPSYTQAGEYTVVVSVTDGTFSVNDTAVVTVTQGESPEVAGVVAVSITELQIRFNEDVTAVEVANFEVGGAAPTAVDMPKADVAILTIAAIDANTDYTVKVTGVSNLLGVTIVDTTVGFKLVDPGELPIDITINDFETDVGNWAHPTYSGSTSGILTTSTFEVSDEFAYAGSKSGKMTLLDDPAVEGGWFVRLWNINRVDKLAADSKLFLYLRGADADIQIRLLIRDDGSGGDNGYEAGAWHDITITEGDWQVVSLDLLNDPVTGWVNGNGVITSTNTVSIDCIQLQCSEDISPILYFDMITERPNISPVEVTFEVDMSLQVANGNFNIVSDIVDVAGTFNDWGGNVMVMDDADGDTVYSITVTELYPGETLEYKFRINSNWDTSEFPSGGPNRTYVVPAENSVVFHWYNDEWVGITNSEALPKAFALHQNYPNPFNPITTIKYELPKESLVKIIVFNLMGKEVRTLVSQKQNAGYQTVIWDASDNFGRRVSSGYYIYIMQAESFHKTQKMILLK